MNEERREAIRQGVIERLKREGRFTGGFVKTEKVCECGVKFKPHRASQTSCGGKCPLKVRSPEQRAKAASNAVSKRRRKLKQMAVDALGGKCSRCGYSKCVDALEFHHTDPQQKDFSISADGSTRSWEAISKEIEKCDLLCANCHREVHAGFDVE